MADQLPSTEDETPSPDMNPKKGGQRRLLSYLLLILGAAGIVFNNNISQATGISVTVLQVATFAIFIIGAALFFSVRETADRVSSYRDVFTNRPADSAESVSPGEPVSTEPRIEPATKDSPSTDLTEK